MNSYYYCREFKIVLPAGCANKIQNVYGMSLSEILNGWFIYAKPY
jgi:hypothetical protein